MSKQKQVAQPEPKIIYKGSQSFRHDLFRFSVVDLKKNTSYKKGEIKLELIPHTHFFHTFDSNARPQTHSTPTGGHYHEVKWSVGEDGLLHATCGPALRVVHKKLAGRMKKVIEPVKWFDAFGEKWVEDNHTHVMTYAWSEELTADSVRRRKNHQEAQVQAQMQAKAKTKELGIELGE